ncbi:hypothetical protein PY32053_02595 [Paracoccus yeei]|uniref:Uncharacterized protein n=1 Tax=Paracoccus yeei TaxID=147645 RepID=A0A386UPB9_9RHOB|nr:hypothetical protein PY32053_02595 [Paracoccus yeei]
MFWLETKEPNSLPTAPNQSKVVDGFTVTLLALLYPVSLTWKIDRRLL